VTWLFVTRLCDFQRTCRFMLASDCSWGEMR
jgi:hypothetical protein